MEKQYKYKLAISIMTRNRKLHVQELLAKLSELLYEKNIGLYLFDGNDDDSLSGVVEEYLAKGYDNIHYSYYNPKEYINEINEKGFDWQRARDSKISVDAEYVWLCSDKLVPDTKYLDKVVEQLDKGYSIIVYDVFPPFPWGPAINKEYFDKAEFFRECAPRLQALSVPILCREIIEQYTLDNLEKCYKEKRYTEIELIFQGIAQIEKFSGLLLHLADEAHQTNLKFDVKSDNVSCHIKEKRTLETFVEKVYNTITGLPAIYDSGKQEVMKNISCYWLFSPEGFAMLRSERGYDIKQCFQYLDKFKLVTNVPVPIILGIGLLPPPIAVILRKSIRKYKEIRKIPHY